MGCYTMTCMASGLPILPDTDCVLAFIVLNDDTGVYTSETCLFRFMTFPIYLKMDHYGLSTYFSDRECFNGPVFNTEEWKSILPRLEIRDGKNTYQELIHDAIKYKTIEYVQTTNTVLRMTVYRRDVFDCLVRFGARLSPSEKLFENLEQSIDSYPNNVVERTIETCFDFISPQMRTRLLSCKMGTKKEFSEYIISSFHTLFNFCRGIRAIGRPVVPSVVLSPQDHYYDDRTRKILKEFLYLCFQSIEQWENDNEVEE